MHHWGDVSCVTVRSQLRCQPPVPGQCWYSPESLLIWHRHRLISPGQARRCQDAKTDHPHNQEPRSLHINRGFSQDNFRETWKVNDQWLSVNDDKSLFLIVVWTLFPGRVKHMIFTVNWWDAVTVRCYSDQADMIYWSISDMFDANLSILP